MTVSRALYARTGARTHARTHSLAREAVQETCVKSKKATNDKVIDKKEPMTNFAQNMIRRVASRN